MLLLKQNQKVRYRKRLFAILILILISSEANLILAFPLVRSPLPHERVLLGNEIFLEDFPSVLKNKRLGLVINHTSSLPDGTLLVRALLDKGITIKAIFSPEHGFSGKEEAGSNIKDGQLENIQIYSLFGKTKKPTPNQMQEIDALVYDIQDIGTRFYTYITTLKYILEASSESNKPVYVLDRPNPVGGEVIEGPILKPQFESFIGPCPIPVRYGLTVGELALMMKGEGWVPNDVDLHVIPLRNWKRTCFWEDTGLRWIQTSPNIPTPQTAILYPGIGLLGGIILNQGLGTCNPFLQFGAPWLKPEAIIQDLHGGKDYGLSLESLTYIPRSLPGKTLHPSYENKICHGIRIHITQEQKVLSIRFTLALLNAIKKFHPEHLRPVSRPLKLMFGNDSLTQFLKGEKTYENLLTEMEKDEIWFRKFRQKYLLYD
ncbi:MAG: DUF1343 domain-containing protein [Candidatus Aminicenantes bacterium]|nr:DUF1343 domain-containing protein [Candidatus Aminicenantes bacterium]